MGFEKNRRAEPRPAYEASIAIKVLSSSQNTGLAGTSVHCSTEDISASGIRIHLMHGVPPGTLLSLWFRTTEHPAGMFLFRGTVKWSREMEQGSFAVGVELDDMPEEEATAWHRIIAEKLPPHHGTGAP